MEEKAWKEDEGGHKKRKCEMKPKDETMRNKASRHRRKRRKEKSRKRRRKTSMKTRTRRTNWTRTRARRTITMVSTRTRTRTRTLKVWGKEGRLEEEKNTPQKYGKTFKRKKYNKNMEFCVGGPR